MGTNKSFLKLSLTLGREVMDALPYNLSNKKLLYILYSIHKITGINQRDLSEKLNIDRSSMVKFIDYLESEGLVVRFKDDEDRRSYRIKTTAKGNKILTKIDNSLGSTLINLCKEDEGVFKALNSVVKKKA